MGNRGIESLKFRVQSSEFKVQILKFKVLRKKDDKYSISNIQVVLLIILIL